MGEVHRTLGRDRDRIKGDDNDNRPTDRPHRPQQYPTKPLAVNQTQFCRNYCEGSDGWNRVEMMGEGDEDRQWEDQAEMEGETEEAC